jgi:SAM-dependent methyltransferase
LLSGAPQTKGIVLATPEFTSRFCCASCGTTGLKEILNFGNMPLAGCFPQQEELDSVPQYPFALVFCPVCSLVQTGGVIDPAILFKDYRYLSSIGLTSHFTELASLLVSRFGLNADSKIVEIGSNDGVFLLPMQELGCAPVGFEPSGNVSKVAQQKGCSIINEYFSSRTAALHFARGTVDLFVAANCFAHINEINDVVAGIRYLLKKDGHAVIEIHDVKSLILGKQYDFAYQEHAYYYSLTSLCHLFRRHGLTIVDFDEIPVHSGSLRIYVSNQNLPLSSKVQSRIDEETTGVACIECFSEFARDVAEHRRELRGMLEEIRATGARVIGYGASGRANVLCNFCEITPDLVEYIVDESPERAGRFIPKVNIPVRGKAYFDQDTNRDVVLIFAWNFSKMIMKKLAGTESRFIIPFPSPHIVEVSAEVDRLCTL